MDPAQSDLQEALDALFEEMLLAEPVWQPWYRTAMSAAKAGDINWQTPILSWYRKSASYKLNRAKASERTLDMQVIATVGNIDPTSVCEDPNCEQRGEMFKDHKVVHKAKGGKKGLRGTCPECQGPMHNERDDARLIAFACLWRQAFGSDARKTPVTAVSLQTVVKMIQSGKITKWADRNLMHTILAPKAPAAGVTPPPASTPSSVAAAVSAPSVRPPSSTATSVSAAATPPPAAAAKKAADPDKQKKLQDFLRGARVQP